MTTYYVKNGGDDGAAGTTWISAWETVGHAASVATAGDTVIFDDGTYDIGAGQTSWNSGASGNEITFEALNSRGAVWKRSANGLGIRLYEGDDYIAFDGIIFDGDKTAGGWSGTYAVYLDGCDYITFYDCGWQDWQERNIFLDSNTTYITVQNCDVTQGVYEDGESNDGILAYGSGISNLVVTGCTFWEIDHVGIYIVGCTDFLIEDCEIYDTHSHLIQPGDPGAGHGWPVTGKIDRCILHDSEGWHPGDAEGHNGIYITGGDVGQVTVQRCDIYNTDWHGIQVGANVVGPVYLYNNTLEACNTSNKSEGSMMRFNDGSAGMNDVVVRNNACYVTHTTGEVVRVSGANMNAALDIDYNDYYCAAGAVTDFYRDGATRADFAAYQAAGYEAHSIDDDPDFVNRANHNFNLNAGSPCIDAGVDVGLPYNVTAPDIGAHEYEAAASPSSSPSPSPSPTPSPTGSPSSSPSPSVSPSPAPAGDVAVYVYFKETYASID